MTSPATSTTPATTPTPATPTPATPTSATPTSATPTTPATPTSSNPDVVVTAPPGQPTIEIVREFDAAPDRVVAAHLDPDLFMRWVGPDDLETEILTWEATTGGSWRYVSRRGEEEHVFFGSFHEVRGHERVVQTFTYEGFPDAVSIEILTAVPLDGGRTRLVATSVFDSVAARDGMVASGMEGGVVAGYRKLDLLLADEGAR